MKEALGLTVVRSSRRPHDHPDVEAALRHTLTINEDLAFSTGFCGGALRSSAAWAEAEARCPDRIRLFFVDDFVQDPAVAMSGLARFLGVSDISDATQQILRRSAHVLTLTSVLESESPQKMLEKQLGNLRDLLNIGIVEELAQRFEVFLANESQDTQAAWESQLGRWLQSPNPRLVAWAHGALKHEPWNPARWWAAHNARMCRPCLFFPRGKCTDDGCTYCHGPGHRKPKRPSHARRKQRALQDRTPSPTSRWERPVEMQLSQLIDPNSVNPDLLIAPYQHQHQHQLIVMMPPPSGQFCGGIAVMPVYQ